MFVLSFDPGYKNLGFCCFHCETHIADMYIVNLTIRDKIKYDFSESKIWDVVNTFIESNKSYFNEACIVAIEKQPLFANFKVQLIRGHLESIIRCKFPNLPVILVSARSTRSFWKTHEKTYELRKEKSMSTSLLSRLDCEYAKQIFKDDEGIFHVDSIEAAQLAIYVYHHLDLFLNKNKQETFINPNFDFKVFSTDVNINPNLPQLKPSKFFFPQKKSKYFQAKEEI